MKLAKWSLDGIEELKAGYRDFIRDLKDPLFYVAVAIVLGIFAAILFA